jgi:16S rRNA A1518/A1519 N6-dimethyltransferase RsmA/KsgA/DIM1 with predicted DNA glycosylase/AP lyase activity
MEFIRQSELFNKTADYYDIYRQSYPVEIFNLLETKANLDSNSKLLEIGSGTGKATELLASKGHNILCIDLGEDLNKICREKLKDYKNINFYTDRFENADIRENNYDLIFSAQAFHWLYKMR